MKKSIIHTLFENFNEIKQDSEDTIPSAEINATSFESPVIKHVCCKKTYHNLNIEKKQEPISEIFAKKYLELAELKNDIFCFL